MDSIRINISTVYFSVCLLMVVLGTQHGVFGAIEQKPEPPLWHLSSTQSTALPTSSPGASSSTSSVAPPSVSTTISSNKRAAHSSTKDEIYIDDEEIEGSGGRGEIHDDLEKEPEYSGSGFGPDDEDSSSTSTHSHKPTSHNTNTDRNGYKPQSNSKPNKQEPVVSTPKIDEKKVEPTHETDLDFDVETGSGDRPDTDDNDGDDDGDDDEDDDDDNDNVSETGHGFGQIIPDIGGANDNDDDDDLKTEVQITDDNSSENSRPDTETGIGAGEGSEIDLDQTSSGTSSATDRPTIENHSPSANDVYIMDKTEDRTTSFFAQPGILAAVIGGAVVGLLCAILVVMFIVYRMRKKDEGSYALDEPKRSPAGNSYAKSANNREFYA